MFESQGVQTSRKHSFDATDRKASFDAPVLKASHEPVSYSTLRLSTPRLQVGVSSTRAPATSVSAAETLDPMARQAIVLDTLFSEEIGSAQLFISAGWHRSNAQVRYWRFRRRKRCIGERRVLVPLAPQRYRQRKRTIMLQLQRSASDSLLLFLLFVDPVFCSTSRLFQRSSVSSVATSICSRVVFESTGIGNQFLFKISFGILRIHRQVRAIVRRAKRAFAMHGTLDVFARMRE